MSEYADIKNNDDYQNCLYKEAKDIRYLIDIIEKQREALITIDMMGDGECCTFIRDFSEAIKAIDNMRTEAEKALKLTEE